MLTNIVGYLEVYYKQLQAQSWGGVAANEAATAAYSSVRQLRTPAHINAHLLRQIDAARAQHGVVPYEVLAREADAVEDLAADLPLVKAATGSLAVTHKQLNTALHATHHHHDYEILPLSRLSLEPALEAEVRALGLQQALLALSHLRLEFSHMRHALQVLHESLHCTICLYYLYYLSLSKGEASPLRVVSCFVVVVAVCNKKQHRQVAI